MDFISKKMNEGPKEKGLFEINGMALEKERNGEHIIHMEIGRPDFDTPESIKDAAIAALKAGDVHYTNLRGTDALRTSISHYLKEMIGMDYAPFTEVLVTVGASEALHAIWSAFCDPGDEVLVPSPYYGSYRDMIKYTYATMVEVPIIGEGAKVDYAIEKFEKALTDKTKMIVLNSPNNPTGYVCTREEIEAIAEFAKKHDLLVVSDDCYDHYVFEGEYFHIATLPGMRERTLIVNSTSKTYAMTGWRVGFIAGPAELVNAPTLVHGNETVCPASFAQAGAAYAFGNDIPEVAKMSAEFERRKDYIKETLGAVKELSFIEPKGAFYVFLNIGATGLSGADFCEELLQETGVTLSPGTVFGADWKDYVRISYASSMENIVEAMEHIKNFVAKRVNA